MRAALREALRNGPRTARELSAQVGIPEKQVAGHLEHLGRSLKAAGQRLHVGPARCLDCGFVFRRRDRLSRPSRCPVCRGERVDAPRFAILGD
ncbi:MAG: transcriptional regulator [Candidatus Rokubacteria bacterium]|nr:transcriptional regulator [Candidatus Rokubacteria bacterium]